MLLCKLQLIINCSFTADNTLMKTLFLNLGLTALLMLGTSVFAAQNGISQQQALDIAKQTSPGRVLSIKRSNDVYKVKTLSDSGKVRIILIDARNGKIISGN